MFGQSGPLRFESGPAASDPDRSLGPAAQLSTNRSFAVSANPIWTVCIPCPYIMDHDKRTDSQNN